jgi:hypothetical protein
VWRGRRRPRGRRQRRERRERRGRAAAGRGGGRRRARGGEAPALRTLNRASTVIMTGDGGQFAGDSPINTHSVAPRPGLGVGSRANRPSPVQRHGARRQLVVGSRVRSQAGGMSDGCGVRGDESRARRRPVVPRPPRPLREAPGLPRAAEPDRIGNHHRPGGTLRDGPRPAAPAVDNADAESDAAAGNPGQFSCATTSS